MIIICYIIVGVALYFLLLDRYDLITPDSGQEASVGLDIFIFITWLVIWPIMILSWEMRFLGRKFFDKE